MCECVCACACVCARACLCVCACARVCVRACVCVLAHVRARVRACVRTCVCVCMLSLVFMCMQGGVQLWYLRQRQRGPPRAISRLPAPSQMPNSAVTSTLAHLHTHTHTTHTCAWMRALQIAQETPRLGQQIEYGRMDDAATPAGLPMLTPAPQLPNAQVSMGQGRRAGGDACCMPCGGPRPGSPLCITLLCCLHHGLMMRASFCHPPGQRCSASFWSQSLPAARCVRRP